MKIFHKGYQTNQTPRNHMERGRPPNPPLNQPNQLQQQQSGQPQSYYGQSAVGNLQQQPQGQQSNRASNSINTPGQPNRVGTGGPLQTNTRMGQQPQAGQQQQQKKPKFYLAMFDYDPTTMSPNPDGCEEELPFQEGDTIKVSSVDVCRCCHVPISLCFSAQEKTPSRVLASIGIGFLKSVSGWSFKGLDYNRPRSLFVYGGRL